jgi:hypothetical protein
MNTSFRAMDYALSACKRKGSDLSGGYVIKLRSADEEKRGWHLVDGSEAPSTNQPSILKGRVAPRGVWGQTF